MARYASVKRVELAGVSDQWDGECYAYLVPATYEDNKLVIEKTKEGVSELEKIDFQIEFVRGHFISGKIKTFNGSDFVLDDMTSDDATASVAITDYLYTQIMGFDFDPKDMRKAASEQALQSNESQTTETSSSEG